jgi:hypothetical protein
MMVAELWCRVRMVDADGATLVDREFAGPSAPDLGVVDDLALLALLAKRLGGGIHLADVSPGLRELLELAGLRVEVEGQPEGGEEAFRIQHGQEEHHAGDPATGDLEDL